MGNLWLKIKVFTKIAIFAVLSIAALVLVIQNINKPVKIWLWNEYDTTLLKVLFFTALVSVIFTILVGTAFRTVRQISEIRARSRSQRLEEEIRDMKQKASMLQTKPPGGGGAGGASASSPDLGPPIEPDPKP
ncbi:MAG: lipopolysaccharide assembly protein [Phycisphaerales bacterium]|jgi:hypothetical protein|nr:lipopolysaccharide assembly protein [Phycisphaerales bacterium]